MTVLLISDRTGTIGYKILRRQHGKPELNYQGIAPKICDLRNYATLQVSQDPLSLRSPTELRKPTSFTEFFRDYFGPR
jgi:hypothetical protein